MFGGLNKGLSETLRASGWTKSSEEVHALVFLKKTKKRSQNCEKGLSSLMLSEDFK